MKEKEEEAAEKEAEAEISEDLPGASADALEEEKADAVLPSAESKVGDESDLATEAGPEAEEDPEAVAAAEVDEEDQPSPQQLEAVQILADLIQLTS